MAAEVAAAWAGVSFFCFLELVNFLVAVVDLVLEVAAFSLLNVKWPGFAGNKISSSVKVFWRAASITLACS